MLREPFVKIGLGPEPEPVDKPIAAFASVGPVASVEPDTSAVVVAIGIVVAIGDCLLVLALVENRVYLT